MLGLPLWKRHKKLIWARSPLCCIRTQNSFNFMIHSCMETLQRHTMQHHSWLWVTSGLHRLKEHPPTRKETFVFLSNGRKSLWDPKLKLNAIEIVYFKPHAFFLIFLYFIISFWAISIQRDKTCSWWDVNIVPWTRVKRHSLKCVLWTQCTKFFPLKFGSLEGN